MLIFPSWCSARYFWLKLPLNFYSLNQDLACLEFRQDVWVSEASVF